MSLREQAREILNTAEVELRALMRKALTDGSYQQIASLAQLAESLSALKDSALNRPSAMTPARVPPRHSGSSGSSSNRSRRHRSRPIDGSQASSSESGKNSKAYPQFVRDGDRLVKIGWSKKRKAEYEHRAPKTFVEAVVNDLRQAADKSKKIEVEDLFPVVAESGDEVPAYQVYLAIAWLRATSAIEKKGRDGYVLNGNMANKGMFIELWNDLPERD